MTDYSKEFDPSPTLEELCGFCRGFSEFLQNPEKAEPLLEALVKEEADESTFSSEDFRREFARLFYGVCEETLPLTATPWSRFRVSDSASPIKQCADLYLFSNVENTTTLPPDHLAVQLSFLGKLLNDGKTEEGASFLEKQILTWVPALNSAVQKKSQSAEIKILFSLLEEYLQEARLTFFH